MNTVDQDGVEWMSLPDPASVQRPNRLQAAPFTNIASPIGAEHSHPLIDHSFGAGLPFARQERGRRNYELFEQGKIQSWGPSSPNAVDWRELKAATAQLVHALINGDVAAARQAIASGADPDMTVSVRDPMQLGATSLARVEVPIGVAAVMRGRELAAAGSPSHAHAELAQMLLHTKSGQPRISLGVAPDGDGQAVGYVVDGEKFMGPDAGQESREHRWARLPQPLFNAVARVCDKALIAGRVAPADPYGRAFGENVPDHGGYMNIQDVQEGAMVNKILGRRARLAQDVDLPAPTPPEGAPVPPRAPFRTKI